MLRWLCLLPLSLSLASCGASSSSAVQPGAPQVLLDRSLPGDGASYRVTVDREVYPPHYAGLLHTHPGPGTLCLLQGQLTIEVVGQQPRNLAAGQCWPEMPGVAHRPVNETGREAVAVFYLFAPAGEPRIQAA